MLTISRLVEFEGCRADLDVARASGCGQRYTEWISCGGAGSGVGRGGGSGIVVVVGVWFVQYRGNGVGGSKSLQEV